MPDCFDVLFGTTLGIVPERVHSYVHVRTDILVPEPRLKVLAGRIRRRRDPLNRFARFATPYQQSNAVGRFKVLKNVVRRGQGIQF